MEHPDQKTIWKLRLYKCFVSTRLWVKHIKLDNLLLKTVFSSFPVCRWNILSKFKLFCTFLDFRFSFYTFSCLFPVPNRWHVFRFSFKWVFLDLSFAKTVMFQSINKRPKFFIAYIKSCIICKITYLYHWKKIPLR